ncbi:MAG: cupredoxin domain-containing protein [Acetobacteraceae bacterium]|nr:cupredoxin domain-containing protein [Acetobacteraceae bacterium]
MRLGLTLLLLLLTVPPAWADNPPEVTIAFVGDRVDPAEVPVPANVKVALKIENRSNVAMEWEGKPLHREKVVAAGGKATVSIGPLKPGSYEFHDDFHPKVRGNLVVRRCSQSP